MSVSPDTRSRVDTREELIADRAHAIARRIGDVVRAGSRAQPTILIDDEENILQASRHGVQLDGIFRTRSQVALGAELSALAHAGGVPVRRLTDGVAAELFGGEKRARVFALARRPSQYALGDLAPLSGDIVILDGVRLAGNIGALTRTAAALGAAGLVLVETGLSSVYDRRLIRASRGMVFALPVVIASREQVEQFLREVPLTLLSLAATATTPLAEIAAVRGRAAILLGSERRGASRELDSLASHRFAVQMSHRVESLNVSVAGAIALYERLHRHPPG
ncbi:TrmH family RNA methyltransferase [Ruania halotolerans]|uniref:TrmH family RNA methyltransferase n=1 Tax=Ruania halotolerans TaxID=2897773 RepID=UPI001E62AFF0|nr:TrmH family RNA methyltransferase [Ruania halotolerans]UFU08201.1 NshR/TsnR family 23S rRNA methyltransferase [Ruania halotolerans]